MDDYADSVFDPMFLHKYLYVNTNPIIKEGINYNYDLDGKLLSVTDNNGTISYTYDSMDRLSSIKTYDGKVVNYLVDRSGMM